MTHSCPDCGASMEFEQREVLLRTGTCPSCAKEFAFVEGTSVASRLPSSPGGAVPAPDQGATAPEGLEGGPECETCGAPLTFRPGDAGSIEVVCADCETSTVFVPQKSAPRLERVRDDRPERPERFERPRQSPRFDSEGPRGRPCRKCGATLKFSTDDSGNLVGECESCGNRFTLPPRDDSRGPPRDRGGPRYGKREYRPSSGGRPPYRGGGGYGGRRPYRSADRRGPPRTDDDDGRRKRRRRED